MSKIKLHRYQSGRYHISRDDVEVIFSDVERASVGGYFELLNEKGEIVGMVDAVAPPRKITRTLDDLADGEDIEKDESISKITGGI